MEMTIQLHSEGVARDIENLQERRENIFRALEGLRMALENLMGKGPDFVQDIEPFLKIRETLPWPPPADGGKLKAQELAFGIWLGKQKSTFNVRPEAAAQALGYVPPEVEELVIAWATYDENSSEEPGRYWSATRQKFRLLPVTDAEKEAIAGRSRLSFHSEEAAKAFKAIREQCDLVNYLNKTANAATEITPGVLQAQFPLLVRTLKVQRDSRNVPFTPRQYYPAYEVFGTFPEHENRFDE